MNPLHGHCQARFWRANSTPALFEVSALASNFLIALDRSLLKKFEDANMAVDTAFRSKCSATLSCAAVPPSQVPSKNKRALVTPRDRLADTINDVNSISVMTLKTTLLMCAARFHPVVLCPRSWPKRTKSISSTTQFCHVSLTDVVSLALQCLLRSFRDEWASSG
jgi:hypothetical protein